MFIAFEGPDEVGKSTSAKALSTVGEPIYNITRQQYMTYPKDVAQSSDTVVTFDRIDWLTHLVYRLAMPHKDWNDDRIRTVFGMPETNLILKMHHPSHTAIHAHGEGYDDSAIALVNELYWYEVDFLMRWNKSQGYSLFRSVGVVQVINDQHGSFEQQLVAFDSKNLGNYQASAGGVTTDEALLAFLRHDEAQGS